MAPTALVTHATEFAGPAAVDALGAAGFRVLVHDAGFVPPQARRADLASRPQVHPLAAQDPGELVAEAIGAAAAIDVVISNDCHPAIVGPVEQADLQDLRASLEALVVRPFALVRAIVPHLKRAGGGAIVLITSPRARLPVPGGSIPDAAREAGSALVRSFARELAPAGIAVNAIAPNFLASEMYDPRVRFVDDPAGRAFVERMVPIGRLGQPQELGERVVFLATNRARFMTGSTLEFTGGWPVAPLPPPAP